MIREIHCLVSVDFPSLEQWVGTWNLEVLFPEVLWRPLLEGFDWINSNYDA